MFLYVLVCCLINSGLFDGGWTAQYVDTKQFLQIDLGNFTMVTGIATQGNYANNWWVKSYTLEYGNLDGNFTNYNNDQVCLKTVKQYIDVYM